MQLEVGKILEGKVTGITKFGAFVELESGKVGLVHISEVSPTYVNDIADHLQNGQTVKVKVLSIGDDGKISLSIKKAMASPPRDNNQGRKSFQKPQSNNNSQQKPRQFSRNDNSGGQNRKQGTNGENFTPRSPYQRQATVTPGSDSFEDMLSKFMKNSDEKISSIKQSKQVNRRGGGKRK